MTGTGQLLKKKSCLDFVIEGAGDSNKLLDADLNNVAAYLKGLMML